MAHEGQDTPGRSNKHFYSTCRWFTSRLTSPRPSSPPCPIIRTAPVRHVAPRFGPPRVRLTRGPGWEEIKKNHASYSERSFLLSWLVVKEKPEARRGPARARQPPGGGPHSHRAVGPTAPRSSFPFSARACRYKYPVALLAPPPFVPLLSHGQIPLVVYSSGAGCEGASPAVRRPLPSSSPSARGSTAGAGGFRRRFARRFGGGPDRPARQVRPVDPTLILLFPVWFSSD